MTLSAHQRTAIEQVLRTRLLDLVADGADAVLDFSFWPQRMRGGKRVRVRVKGNAARSRIDRVQLVLDLDVWRFLD